MATGQVTQVAEPTPSILELVSTVVIPATTSRFVACEKFVVNIRHNARVKISYLDGNFTEWFLNGDGKIEDSISERTLHYAKLREASVGGPIIAELGGEEKSETTLTELFALMAKQGDCEEGVLLNSSLANIFYIKDRASVLRVVYVRSGVLGWDVYAYSSDSPGRWSSGIQVFFRAPSVVA